MNFFVKLMRKLQKHLSNQDFLIKLETTMLSDLVANHHDHVGNT